MAPYDSYSIVEPITFLTPYGKDSLPPNGRVRSAKFCAGVTDVLANTPYCCAGGMLAKMEARGEFGNLAMRDPTLFSRVLDNQISLICIM